MNIIDRDGLQVDLRAAHLNSVQKQMFHNNKMLLTKRRATGLRAAHLNSR